MSNKAERAMLIAVQATVALLVSTTVVCVVSLFFGMQIRSAAAFTLGAGIGVLTLLFIGKGIAKLIQNRSDRLVEKHEHKRLTQRDRSNMANEAKESLATIIEKAKKHGFSDKDMKLLGHWLSGPLRRDMVAEIRDSEIIINNLKNCFLKTFKIRGIGIVEVAAERFRYELGITNIDKLKKSPDAINKTLDLCRKIGQEIGSLECYNHTRRFKNDFEEIEDLVQQELSEFCRDEQKDGGIPSSSLSLSTKVYRGDIKPKQR